ncbi:MAG: NAD(P) transhydrogenase subunit alpha [Planctomycetota bacterium]|jgi:NAD(P) transhydrogenase subunit alpha
MRLGIPNEAASGETRVAVAPDVLPKLQKLDLEVRIERGAGEASGFTDANYEAKGATMVDRAGVLECEMIASLSPPDPDSMRDKQILVCMPDPLGQAARINQLKEKGVSCIALELMPRISRAQAMDVLSSMANVAGYKAVLVAAARSPKLFPMMMTAAGTVRPAKCFVLGAGVAGLQAIATARRLGAVVEAYDIRAETQEQVESLGARFVKFDLGTGDQQDAGGYAKELTAEQKKRQSLLMAEVIQAADIVITTAQVPGRRAPRLITEDVVDGMKPGAVVVDMAADSGGNCAYSQPGEEVMRGGVLILGPTNLPGQAATTSSQLYSNNVLNFLSHFLEEGKPKFDLEDEVIAGPLVCHEGRITNERVEKALAATEGAGS